MVRDHAWWLALTLAVGPSGVCPAFAEDTPAAGFSKLKAEYDAELKALTKSIVDPKTGQVERYEITGEVPPDKYLGRLLEFGQSKDEATAVASLSLAVYGWPTDQRAEKAFDLM